MQPEDREAMHAVSTWQIRCRAEDVHGKAEIRPESPEEIDFQ
jgi:hypothetical protein